MEKIKFELNELREKVVLPETLGFGKIFTNHIFEMDYNPEQGWHSPAIRPLYKMDIHPGMMYLHYGQGIFEGLKAFKTTSGEVVIFRPEKHFQRLNNSAKKVCMPPVDVQYLLHALNELLSVEQDWIPENTGESLYIRPFMFGTDPFLGVRPSQTYKFIIMLSPVGAYYPEGFKPVKILAQDDHVRAVRKGIGDCKTPANYAASLLAADEAKKKGYTQVLWLDGVEQKYIEEVGTMNIFIRFKDEIATPKLTGSILPGVTRDSVLQILRDWGMNATERLISINELAEEYEKGNLLGVFGTGTAAVISSVGWLSYKDHDMVINNGKPDEVAIKLFNELTGIHYGKIEDKRNWITRLNINKVEA